jgi:DNA-binding NarL/FixJ family response regulator
MHDESLYAARVLRAGARGYIMKDEAVSDLQEAIRRVRDGQIYLSERMAQQLLESVAGGSTRPTDSPLDRLSDREREVFELLGRGLSIKEIGKRLHLSVKTIETYKAHLKQKLNLESTSQLVRHAVSWVERG